MKKIIVTLLVASLLFYPLLPILIPKVQALEISEEEAEVWDELEDLELDSNTKVLSDIFGSANNIEKFTAQGGPPIVVSENDLEAVREGRIDERVLQSLIHLVTPEEQGGAGFERLKIKRLVKGYSTEQRAASKETEYENEGEANISAHFKGQAVDISEIDLIQLKQVTKKKAFGITISKKEAGLPPAPINVAWQSETGKGEGLPGFYGNTANELFGNLSMGNLKEILSDEFDYNLSTLIGENLPDWAKWIGVIMLFEDFDLPQEGFVEENDLRATMKEMGRATLAEHLRIDKEAVRGGSLEELTLNMGRNSLEKQLELAPGSLEGDSLDEIFKNAGRRKLEEQLKLRRGTLDGNLKEGLGKIEENPTWKAYRTNQAKNEAFDIPSGAAELIRLGDEDGLRLIGAAILSYAFAAENKEELITNIKNKQPTNKSIEIDETNLKTEIGKDTLSGVVTPDNNKRKETLKSIGKSVLAAIKFFPDLSIGLNQAEWDKIKQGKTKVDDFVLTLGAKKYERELELPTNSLLNILQGGLGGDVLANIGRAAWQEQDIDLDKYQQEKVQKAINEATIGFEGTDEEMSEAAGKAGDKARQQVQEDIKNAGKDVLKRTIVRQLNRQYGLTGSLAKYEVTEQDVVDMLSGKWQPLAQKISSHKIDKALKLPENGALDLITGKKSASQIFKESGAIRLGGVLGLTRPVSIEGNLQLNYGQALVEQVFGLKPGSFSQDVSKIAQENGLDKFKAVFANPEENDALLGLAPGTTLKMLQYDISIEEYNKRVSTAALVGVTLDKLTNFFGFEEEHKPSQEEFNKMLFAVQNWDKASEGDKAATFAVLEKISGQSWDSKLEFEPGTFAQIFANPSGAPDILLTQGMKKLTKKVFGIDKEVFVLHYKEGKGLDFKINNVALQDLAIPKIKEMTGIEIDEDAKSFLNGNIKDGFAYWGLASITKEANEIIKQKGLMPQAQFNYITYEEAKRAFFGDWKREEFEFGMEANFHDPGWEESAAGKEFKRELRKELRGEARKNFQYKISDALLIDKIDESIPLGFTKAMYEGTPEERTTMMGAFVLSKLTKGQISLSQEQIQALNIYMANKTPVNFENLRTSGVFNSVDAYLNKNELLGFKVQPGTTAALIKAAQGGDNLKEGLKELAGAYSDWASAKVFDFADKKLSLPVGTTSAIYRQYQNYKNAYDTYKAIKAGELVGDVTKAGQALDAAKADGIALAVNLVFGKTFSKIDNALGLPSGTTSGLVTLLITGNPIPLIMAIASSFITVKVEIYAEKPVCERALKEKIEWEKLSGNAEKDFPFYQRHAQCSVKRILGALLDMSQKTGNQNLKVIQILTQRQEDVDANAEKIYSLYGKTQFERGLRGLMSGEAFWQYIHVGY